ncbi:hypothetical protein HOY80DRAFT_1042629 [Tuber brumale]|nr:hypothetical protein HOY80DRAFT_1042629 [Tuber brumale]
MTGFLLAVLGPILTDGVRLIESEEAQVLTCVKSIIEFPLVLGQRGHSDYTLGLLDSGRETFYGTKSVFCAQRKTKPRTQNFEKRWAATVKENQESAFYHFQFPEIHMLSHATNGICQMGLTDNFSADISELFHIANMKEAYLDCNRVQYEEQMIWYNDRHTGIAYMVQILEHLALRGMYDHDSARVHSMPTRTLRLHATRFVRYREEVRKRTRMPLEPWAILAGT